MIERRSDCRVCGSKDLKVFFNFGLTPLANSYVEERFLEKLEVFYPLILNECGNCGNFQLSHVVDPAILFRNYLYASSTSSVTVNHYRDFALKMGKKRFVIDIGGNDGILLKPFKELGSDVLNIDPNENIECSVPIVREFFANKVAKKILEKHGRADLITACNVFAHADDLDDIVKGVKTLLSDDGEFVVEVADFNQMLKDGTFDMIYHEHVNYWTEDCLRLFFKLREMKVTKVEYVSPQGGSLRIYVHK